MERVMAKTSAFRLESPRHRMPESIRKALLDRGLMEAYKQRPPYQRNDYLGWILRAKRPETRDKRLAQMLSELAAGDTYMNMAYGRPMRRLTKA
jgi:uncharacterized protein YdeI (YjbR/CyaY-like superfamily)